ncbi:hypothetical protein [Mesorhizobium sp. M0674]|uniref:hypothetical protein n=1 Tax=unclassified Mesorhizobium TaxID=325217 RepID=UPI00333BF048
MSVSSRHGRGAEGQIQSRERRPLRPIMLLGRMRNQTFFSLAEANAAIRQALDRIDDHVMRRLVVSRRQLFESVERAALTSLPSDDYEFAEWRLARVSTDSHVE